MKSATSLIDEKGPNSQPTGEDCQQRDSDKNDDFSCFFVNSSHLSGSCPLYSGLQKEEERLNSICFSIEHQLPVDEQNEIEKEYSIKRHCLPSTRLPLIDISHSPLPKVKSRIYTTPPQTNVVSKNCSNFSAPFASNRALKMRTRTSESDSFKPKSTVDQGSDLERNILPTPDHSLAIVTTPRIVTTNSKPTSFILSPSSNRRHLEAVDRSRSVEESSADDRDTDSCDEPDHDELLGQNQTSTTNARNFKTIFIAILITMVALVGLGFLFYFVVNSPPPPTSTTPEPKVFQAPFEPDSNSTASTQSQKPPSKLSPPGQPQFRTGMEQAKVCGKFSKVDVPESPKQKQFVEDSINNLQILLQPNQKSAPPFSLKRPESFTLPHSSRGPAASKSLVRTRRRRVVGGSDVKLGTIPWQASLWVDRYICGGSVIARRWILTAAHCSDNYEISASWRVYVGLRALSKKDDPPAQTSLVNRIFKHQQYTGPPWYDYDVALYKLKSELNFTEYVQPICLPQPDFIFPPDPKCFISGWGATLNPDKDKGQYSDILQKAQIDIISQTVCNQWIQGHETSRMICAGKREGGKDACQGDSGSPLSYYEPTRKIWIQVGSASWGMGCGRPEQPGIYEKTSYFTKWITKVIGTHSKRDE